MKNSKKTSKTLQKNLKQRFNRTKIQILSMFEAEELFPRKDLGGMSHASTITEDKDGKLYCVWYAGSWEKEADVKIYMATKHKNEKDWSEPKLIEKEGITSKNPFLKYAESEEEREELENEETSEGNPVIYSDWKTGRLWLFWETMRGAGENSGWTMCILKMKDSMDGGESWSDVRVLREDIGWGTRNKPIELSNGEIILPVAAFGSSAYRWTREEFSKGSQDCEINEPPQEEFILGKYSQPAMIETKPGHVKCYMRTNKDSKDCENLIAVSESDDYGHTWGEVHPLKQRIPNPDSGLDVVKLQNEHVVLLCNPLRKGRQKLTAFLSEDGGETFQYQRDLEKVEEGKEYHYPAVIQTSEGNIHVSYTNQRLNIKHACFDEEWIKKGGEFNLS